MLAEDVFSLFNAVVISLILLPFGISTITIISSGGFIPGFNQSIGGNNSLRLSQYFIIHVRNAIWLRKLCLETDKLLLQN